MKTENRKLVLQQIDNRMSAYRGLVSIPQPGEGWIQAIRTALNMTQEQLAKKMGITPQSLSDFEKREKNGTITLNSLKLVARALGMDLVYAITTAEETLEQIIDGKAMEKAREIVNRTATSMELEDQGNSPASLMKAFENKRKELNNEIPKFLWD
jgi:predicted DNA-binding mobile mystery protein A